jgi:acetyl-CoA carboxylase biotin carboxyl carrier protein
VSDLPLTPDDVTEIVAILDGSGYERLDIRTSRFRLRVARDGAGWTQEWDWKDDAPAVVADIAQSDTDTEMSLVIRAPLPGIFYRAPQPGAAPFVQVGDRVGPDTVVAIIETMKLMNPVYAGANGTITAIIAANAEAVAGDAVLMRIA